MIVYANDTTLRGFCLTVLANRGGHWDFRFWLFFLDRFFGFGVYCSLQIFRFFASGFRFSVFVTNTSGFSVLVSDVVFGFSYFVLFGFRFLFDLSGS